MLLRWTLKRRLRLWTLLKRRLLLLQRRCRYREGADALLDERPLGLAEAEAPRVPKTICLV